MKVLPLPAADIVGRDLDVRSICGLLRTERVVTLVGPGGVGKTRLALEVAHELDADFELVSWVELAHVDAGADLAGEVRRALGASVERKDSDDWRDLDTTPTLLVLDNCEHMVGQVVPLVSAITRSSRATKVMATSRNVLGVEAEQTFSVEPLSVPVEASAAAMGSPAVLLFADRVRRARPEFEVTMESLEHVVSIVRSLDGLPLGLEIVAGHVRSFGLERLAAMVQASPASAENQRRDVDERHRTLETNLAWSRELLGESEQRALGELAAFVPDFSLEAAVSVGEAEVAAVIPSLVAHSLLNLGDDRYRMLDVVRRDALGRLDSATRRYLFRRHADWCAGLADRFGHRASGAEVSMIDPSVRCERTNLISAISWCSEICESDLLVDIVGPLALTWVHVGWPVDDEAWLDAATHADADHLDNALLVMLGLAYRRSWRGDATGARELLESLVQRSSGEIAAHAFVVDAQLELAGENIEAAREKFGQAARLFDAESSAWNRAYVRFCQARCEESVNPSRAALLFEQSVELAAVDAYPVLHGLVLERQARFAQLDGRPAEALRLAQESRRLHESASFPEGAATSANREGFVLTADGYFVEALECHRSALARGMALDHAGLLFDSLFGLALAVEPLAGARTAGRMLRLAERYESNRERAVVDLLGRVPDVVQRLGIDAFPGNEDGHPMEAIAILDALDVHGSETAPGVDSPRVAAVEALSDRELTVLRLLRGELTQREIAGELIVAPSTVRSHVKAIYRKLGVSSREEALNAGTAAGLI